MSLLETVNGPNKQSLGSGQISLVSIYVMLILWTGGGELRQTQMIYGSKAACEDAITAQAATRGVKIKEASCKSQRIKQGVPIQITEGLTFTPY